MDIYELMKQVNEWVKEILQDNYVGVYKRKNKFRNKTIYLG